jgi:hypothetical protein
MAKQTINIGTSANKGDGDPLRTAFDKINDNFDELYASSGLDLDSIGSNMIPATDGAYALGSASKQWTDLYVRDFVYIGGTRLESDNAGNIVVSGGSLQIKDVQGDIFADDSTKVFDSATQTFTGKFEGEFNGTIAADDSTVLIDGPAGTINASALTGALPAIDGSNLTGVVASSLPANATFTNLTANGVIDFTSSRIDFDGAQFSNFPSSLITDINGSIFADDSTLLVDSVNGTVNATALTGALPAIDGSSLTGITTAFSNITSTPTTLAGYGITDAVTAGGDLEGNLSGSVFGDDSTLLVDGVNGTLNSSALTKPIALADNEKITFGTDDDLEIFHNSSNGNTIIENAGNLVIKGSNLFLQSATGEDFFRGAANGAVTLYYDDVAKFETTADGVAITGKITGLTDPTAAQDAATKAYVDANSGGGGSGLQSRGTVTGTTSSLADAAEADLDITGFKSYALLAITTDRAARVRLYVSDATRTADASRAEGVDPTSDAGLIAEVITTGADTVIISPGAFGFNLESSPTTTIPCRVTNKSGGTSTVQVDLNILQLEA